MASTKNLLYHNQINLLPQTKPFMDKADLKNAGLKATIPRLKILEILETQQPRHMSAEDIYRHLAACNEDVALATIYRVLTQFESAGLVTRHHFEDHSVFELETGEHHDHIVCVKCNKMEEFVDPIIEKRQAEIAKKLGYEFTDHSLFLYGICQQCQQHS